MASAQREERVAIGGHRSYRLSGISHTTHGSVSSTSHLHLVSGQKWRDTHGSEHTPDIRGIHFPKTAKGAVQTTNDTTQNLHGTISSCVKYRLGATMCWRKGNGVEHIPCFTIVENKSMCISSNILFTLTLISYPGRVHTAQLHYLNCWG